MTRRSKLLLTVITVLGALLRITSPGRIGLWRDEVQALNIASLPTLGDITRFLYAHESHPPLFYYIEHVLGRLTGDTAASMGLMGLLASIALVPAVWWLASLSQVRGASTVAAALVALSVPLSFFSVELRPYAILSLLLVVGTAAFIRGCEPQSVRWRALWAGASLSLVYLHHAGAVAVVAQVLAAMAAYPGAERWRDRVRLWAPFMCVVALGAIPDLFVLAHQSVSASYAVQHPIKILRPFRELWGISISFPGEIALAVFGAIACALACLRTAGLGLAMSPPGTRPAFVAATFLALVVILTLASYRSNLLLPYVVVSMAPLGLVAAGIAIADAVARAQRWRSVVFAEVAVVCVILSTLVFVGNGKTDTDLMTQYISAESRANDLIVLIPGTLGPSFNRAFAGRQSQIDFPVIGKISRYEFDHDFARVSSPRALRDVMDSLASACRAGRRVWLITPVNWTLAKDPPRELTARQHGGMGQSDVARANLLERRITQLFGAAPRRARSSPHGAGVEFLEARLWSLATEPKGTTPGAGCDIS